MESTCTLELEHHEQRNLTIKVTKLATFFCTVSTCLRLRGLGACHSPYMC